MAAPALENAELLTRLKVFGLIIKLGSDIFNAPDFEAAAAMAVNSSRSLLQYKSSAMLERPVKGGSVEIVAQYSRFEVNPHSSQADLQRKVAAGLDFSEGDLLTLTRESIPNLPSRAGEALGALLDGDDPILAVRLAAPSFIGQPEFELIWLIEYTKEIPGFAKNAVSILAHSFGHSLYSRRYCRKGGLRLGSRFSLKKVIWCMIFILLAAAMFVPVREQLGAEFVLKAPETVSAYAWIDGTIARCLYRDGALVKKGEVVIRYDLSQLKFKLASAVNQLDEIRKEYDLESRASFSDRSRLGKVKLLEARMRGAAIAVEEAKWYLEHSKVTAPASGTLSFAEGSAEKLENRAVRTGERLFDVYGGEGAVAEIQVNERESSILSGSFDATLFPYTAPENALRTEIIEVRKTPELTEQRTYCYTVRAKLLDKVHLRYGIRGIAQLRGSRVTLGYYLFRNLVIYLRWL